MSFLDAFQRYHQIPLALADQEKTAFITSTGKYHYILMLFGLKNVGFTYQRMETQMFEAQLGRNIEAYMDDMVVKSKEVFNSLIDLDKVFSIMRKFKLHLNASKCAFEVDSWKFLGYMITHQEIEVNPV